MSEIKNEKRILRDSLFCKNFTEQEYAVVSSLLEYRMIPQGTTVYREGETGDELTICLTGMFSASVRLSNGARRDLFFIEPGDFFGETAVITREPQIITVVAEKTSDVAALRTEEFSRILSDYPLAAVKILRNIGRLQNDRLENFTKYRDDLIRWGEIARRRAIQDDLTGLYNRRFLEDSIRDRFQHWEIGLRKMSLLMLDLDRIHSVNEQYGMKAGDQVIIAVAGIIRSLMRSTDICAHLSGDEFAVLLPDTSGEAAFLTAGRLLDAINSLVVSVSAFPGSTYMVTFIPNVSIGVAEAPAHARTGQELKLAADRALHRAKENGRNRVESAVSLP
jgi:diguanylate cyclase (GGDEF)-like protein